jgi:hypothetical protein
MLLLPATPCNSCSFAMNSFDAGLTVYHKRTSIPSSIGTMLPCFETKSHHAILTFLPPWSFIPQANELSLSQSITYRTATWTPPDKHEEDYPHVHETCRNPESTRWQLFVLCVVEREKEEASIQELESTRSARTHWPDSTIRQGHHVSFSLMS